MTYLNWNNEIARRFFSSSKSGSRVWFSVEQELIEKIAEENKTSFDDFIRAVKNGPDEINCPKQTICGKASAVFNHWRNNKQRFEYPPYIAYLALFVLAVNHGDSDDFSTHNYYGRLRKLAGESSLSTNHFKPTLELWDDLEHWSQKDKEGSFGEFYNDTIGGNFYVGIPSYQVVLRTQDRNQLPKIFNQMGWDSDSNPTEEEILQSLKYNHNLLSHRTSYRINKEKSDFLSILIDRVLEELRDYDEEAEPLNNTNQQSDKRGSIEMCLDIDETAQSAVFSFRCKRKAGLPGKEFILKHSDSDLQWKAQESSSILSSKIKNFKIEHLEKDFCVQTEQYKFHYIGSKYKLFTPANPLGINNWITGQRYAPNDRFFLAVHDNLCSKVQNWGSKECGTCQKLEVSGLPHKWHLFKINGVNGDKGIKKDIPALSIDTELRIRFTGGIRPSKGNKFFNFAPPKVLITGKTTQIIKHIHLIYNQQKINLTPFQESENIFNLLKIPSQEGKATIEVQFKNNEPTNNIKKHFIFVKNRLKKRADYSNNPAMDCFGNFKQFLVKNSDQSANPENSYLKGAYCHNFKSTTVYPKLPRMPLSYIKTIYLTGNKPGQIIIWPQEPWPEWPPVWMIQFKTHKKAAACLINNIKQQNQNPVNGSQKFSIEKINLWQKIVWHNRKRIKSKSKKQWESYTERAKNV